MAIFYGKPKFLEYFLDNGADIKRPPESITEIKMMGKEDDSKVAEMYRKTPFMMQAAAVGNVDCFNYLIRKGSPITASGHFGFSPKKKNGLTSNPLGAAAFYGHQTLMKVLMGKTRHMNIDFETVEKAD
jgi:hypothetical protein